MRYGSLFSGYGGLDIGVQSVLGGSTAWFCEFDKGPSKILAHHWPDVPNLGDITAVDWSQVEPVDVLTGGFPCQDVSHAGRRAGLIRDGEGRTRSGLWGHMLRAINEQRPSLVVAENVRGLLSAKADSDMEPCPWCLGDSDDQPPMRALGAVLADLADCGYDAAWYGLRAADVGAAHGRFRVFIFAWPADTESDTRRLIDRDSGAADGPRGAAADGVTLLPTPMTVNRTSDKAQTGRPTSGPTRGGPSYGLEDVISLLPTPQTGYTGTDIEAWRARRPAGNGAPRETVGDLRLVVEHLLPTPAVNDMGASYTPETWDAWTARMQAEHGNGNGHGKSLSIEAQRLLPTPEASRAGGTAEAHRERKRRSMGRVDPTCTNLDLLVADDHLRWGDYAPAIARWEALTRPAPAPTEPGKSGPRLSAAFVEWLMGLPAGHITDPAIWDGMTTSAARNAALKAGGNGVVPQQAAAAVRAFCEDFEALTGAAA